jgi:hypothetical protein
VQQVLQALLVLTELKVLPVPLVLKAPLVQLVLPALLVQLALPVPLALPEQQMQQISLVFWPSPMVEPDQQHRTLWT